MGRIRDVAGRVVDKFKAAVTGAERAATAAADTVALPAALSQPKARKPCTPDPARQARAAERRARKGLARFNRQEQLEAGYYANHGRYTDGRHDSRAEYCTHPEAG